MPSFHLDVADESPIHNNLAQDLYLNRATFSQIADNPGTPNVQYGKVDSWVKQKKQYKIVLKNGLEIFSPILGSADVHVVGDDEPEASEHAPSSADQQVRSFSHSRADDDSYTLLLYVIDSYAHFNSQVARFQGTVDIEPPTADPAAAAAAAAALRLGLDAIRVEHFDAAVEHLSAGLDAAVCSMPIVLNAFLGLSHVALPAMNLWPRVGIFQ
jgi:hypothetical protein